MTLMIRAIQILPIPARRKRNRGPNPTRTRLIGQIEEIVARARRASERILLDVGIAAMAELLLLSGFGAQTGVADDHAETGLEGGDFGFAVIGRNVVDCDAFAAFEAQVNHLGNSFEGSIPGTEIEICSPVV